MTMLADISIHNVTGIDLYHETDCGVTLRIKTADGEHHINVFVDEDAAHAAGTERALLARDWLYASAHDLSAMDQELRSARGEK